MTTGFVVLRPEPGNGATAAALERDGHDVLRLPLFAVRPLAWEAPDPRDFDALLLTSANAARRADAQLHKLTTLPVVAVGEATAHAAREAGLTVTVTGDQDGERALAAARERGFSRVLHLAGRERHALPGVTVVPVYASDNCPIAPGQLGALTGRIALLHSPRAARRLVALIADRREQIALAALSEAAAAAAGTGWRAVATAPSPTDAALRAAAVALAAAIDRSGMGEDKRP